jgi:hypothetical protein
MAPKCDTQSLPFTIDNRRVTATLQVCIDTPSDGAAVAGIAAGAPLSVTGTAATAYADEPRVQISLNGQLMPLGATVTRGIPGSFTWSWAGNTLVGTPPGGTLTIAAVGSSVVHTDRGSIRLPCSVSINVAPYLTRPNLNITSPIPSTQDSLPDGWPAFPGGIDYPLGPNERFQVIPFPFPRLGLAH